MSAGRAIVRATIAGLLAGALVLGICGRVLMRLVAIANGASGGFSLAGSLEVVAAGAIFGAIAGPFILLVPHSLERWRAVVHAAALFIGIAVFSGAARSAATSITMPARVPAVVVFIPLALGYSLLLSRWARQPAATG